MGRCGIVAKAENVLRQAAVSGLLAWLPSWRILGKSMELNLSADTVTNGGLGKPTPAAVRTTRS